MLTCRACRLGLRGAPESGKSRGTIPAIVRGGRPPADRLMLAKVLSSAVLGVDAYTVKAAIKNCGFDFPPRRITVNLAPADIKKEGAAFDLPMAIGVLAAQGMVKPDRLSEVLVLGELALDGLVRPVRGALPMAVAAAEVGLQGIVLPVDNAPEAAV